MSQGKKSSQIIFTKQFIYVLLWYSTDLKMSFCSLLPCFIAEAKTPMSASHRKGPSMSRLLDSPNNSFKTGS